MTGGLWVFLVVQVLNVTGLLLDLALYAGGHRTISSLVWTYPTLGLPIIAAQIAGLIGLLNHFYGGE